MTRRIRERVQESFDREDQEKVVQYLDWLRAALSDLSGSLRRTVTFLILLMAIFEVVYESPHGTFTLAGFQIDRGSIVLPFIPALIAFLYLQSIVDSVRSAQIQEALRQAFIRWSPQAGRNDLDAYILPAYPLFWNPGNVEPRAENRLATYGTYKFTSIAFLGIIVIITLGYEAQAYYVLFNKQSPGHFILWLLSLLVTVICLSAAVTYFILDSTDRWRG
jgi:hypothetical protein